MIRCGAVLLLWTTVAWAQPDAGPPAILPGGVSSVAPPSAESPETGAPAAAPVSDAAPASERPAAPITAPDLPAPAAVESAAPPTEEPPPALELDAEPDALAAITARLQAFAAGRLTPDIRSSDLFVVDLLNEEQVARRLVELRRRVDHARAQADALLVQPERSPEEARKLSVLQRLLALDGVRLEVLSRTAVERKALLDAEIAGRKVAEERAAAEAARLAAEEAARTAAAAREAALAEARAALDATTRQLAAARAEVEESREKIARLREAQARQKQARADQHAHWVDLLGRANTALAETRLAVDRADSLYTELVSALAQARAALRLALDEPDAVEAPILALGLDLDAPRFRGAPLERDAVVQAQERFAEEAAAWAIAERQRLASRLDDVAADVLALNRARLAMLNRLAPETREAILGLGRAGLDQLAREVEHLSVTGQWYLRTQRPTMARLKSWLFEALGRSSGRWGLFQLLALLVVGGWIWRRPLVVRIDAWVRARRTDYLTLVWRAVRPIWRPVLLLLWIWGLDAILTGLVGGAVVAVGSRLAYTYGFYRLFSTAAHHAFLQLATNPALPVSPELSRRIQRTVQHWTRYIFAVLVFLVLAEALVGRGYLYRVVYDFAWLAAIPLTWWILRHWRDDLLKAWIVRHPEGWLVDRARAGVGRPLGVIWAAPVGARLLVETVTEGATTLALRLSQLRRGFAFLLRRQLERQLEDQPIGPRAPLAPDLLARFTTIGQDDALRIGPFPHLEAVQAEVIRWREGGLAAGPIALIGMRGVGKSVWLQTFAAGAGEGTLLLRLDTPRVTAEALLGWLAEGLGHPPGGGVDALVEAILAGPPRVVLLDDAHLCIRRAQGGTEAIVALLELIRRTAGRIFWICGFGRLLWGWMQFALQRPDVFERVIELEAWSEERLDALLESRLAHLGLTIDFRSLLPERLRGVPAEVARTELRFKQLLWDAAGGLPRTTLHFWAASLDDRGEGRLEVRLFDEANPDALERLDDLARFALNAALTHDRIGLHWASAVLHASPTDCRAVLEQLCAMGCVVRRGELYSVPVGWLAATTRFLQRKHLLHV